MTYQKGLHIIASLETKKIEYLVSSIYLKKILEKAINHYSLKNLGEVFHDFENGGCTGIVCLSESHISFHTWPEYSLINIDIYLSNYNNDNSIKAQHIFSEIVMATESTISSKTEIYR